MFLFDRLPEGRWVLAALALVGLIAVHRMRKQRRRREQLRRRRQIRARLHEAAPPATPAPSAPLSEIDLTEPQAEPGLEIDLRDRIVYGSEITLESGETLESGIVGPLPPD